ncbi:MAG TPA: phage tail sheath C-terminal domain-containing protein [Hanamia sp.]|jgi:phage tail sheath protein FI|nr:phage tail sheath C-terminal domain-containing protein [Hanamia sp.]
MSLINESAIKTPGVYVTEIDAFPPSIAQVDTIPAFVGYTQKAFDPNAKNLPVDGNGNNLINIPTQITSLLDYETYFGTAQLETGLTITIDQTTDANDNLLTEKITPAFTAGKQSNHTMHAAIRFFYDNGGGKCYIVSIAPYKANVGDALVPGDFTAGLEAVKKEDDITLIIFPEGQKLPADTDLYTLQSSALNLCADTNLQDRFCILDLYNTGESVKTSNDLTTATTAFRSNIAPTLDESLNYGAAYFPNLISKYSFSIDGTTTALTQNVSKNGAPPAAGPFNGHHLSELNNALTGDLGLYNRIESVLNNQFPMVMPPSPAIAGIYCSVDATRGIWKAPANVAVQSIIGPACKISDEMQADMNVDPATGKSINAIRSFTGKGTLVWGGRTLLGNDNNWRYISVRRFYIMVEKSVKLAAFRFVFEPNDANTWVRVRAMIENYLTNLWRLGALAGAKPEQAFFVRVGLGLTMTFDDVLNGKLIIEIGMAPVRPAEFIILRFTQIQQTS